jgi:hypothetical protein
MSILASLGVISVKQLKFFTGVCDWNKKSVYQILDHLETKIAVQKTKADLEAFICFCMPFTALRHK